MTKHDTAAPLILFVDDEPTAVKYFQRAVESVAPVVTAGSVEEGRRILDEHAGTLGVLVSDQRMPGGYGNELLQYARTRYPHMVRILTTAYSELDHTVEAVNQGQIHRYIQKPWELSALRMELKQALDLAALRKDHAQLLREKMMVRQNQTVSNRIGALYALCASLARTENMSGVDAYLSAAAAIGIKPPAPDWLLVDYPDLVSAESQRSGRIGHAVHATLAEIRKRHENRTSEDALKVLAELLDGRVQLSSDGSAVIPDASVVTEFLENESDVPVSQQHVSWIAFLIWAQDMNCALAVGKTAAGLQCRLIAPADKGSPARLAAWIEQFCSL